ncbi:MAG TPA: acyl carrier protein [Anaerolineales bacterium]|nr:acyl carrier protein [Anaerolineales bacterium]
MPSTSDVLAEFIAGSLLKDPGRAIAPDEPLITGGLVDSFSLVDLALFVEKTFGVRLHDSELRADVFDSLSQLAALVEQRRSAAA